MRSREESRRDGKRKLGRMVRGGGEGKMREREAKPDKDGRCGRVGSI